MSVYKTPLRFDSQLIEKEYVRLNVEQSIHPKHHQVNLTCSLDSEQPDYEGLNSGYDQIGNAAAVREEEDRKSTV